MPATVHDPAMQVSSFKCRSARPEDSSLNEILIAPASTWILENEFMISFLITGSFAEFQNAYYRVKRHLKRISSPMLLKLRVCNTLGGCENNFVGCDKHFKN